MPNLTALRLVGECGGTAEQLASLQQLQTLELHLDARPDGFADVVRRLPRLTSLSVRGAWFGDDDFEAILTSKLHTLRINSTSVTGQGILRLAGLPSLRQLDLSGRIEVEALEEFTVLDQLERLRIRGLVAATEGEVAMRAQELVLEFNGQIELEPDPGAQLQRR